jgi:lysine 2,3-aminomutase
MPSGHDTLNINTKIDDKISESYATVSTWDGKELYSYEALGRSTRKEFEDGVRIMESFIGRKGVFLPKLIIVDRNGRHIETTNRTKLPVIENLKKSELLGYKLYSENMPLTNPADASKEIDRNFKKSKYFKSE